MIVPNPQNTGNPHAPNRNGVMGVVSLELTMPLDPKYAQMDKTIRPQKPEPAPTHREYSELVDAAVSSPRFAADLLDTPDRPKTAHPLEWAAYRMYCELAQVKPTDPAYLIADERNLEVYTDLADKVWADKGYACDGEILTVDSTAPIGAAEECGCCQGGGWDVGDMGEVRLVVQLLASFAPSVTGGRWIGFYSIDRA